MSMEFYMAIHPVIVELLSVDQQAGIAIPRAMTLPKVLQFSSFISAESRDMKP